MYMCARTGEVVLCVLINRQYQTGSFMANLMRCHDIKFEFRVHIRCLKRNLGDDSCIIVDFIYVALM